MRPVSNVNDGMRFVEHRLPRCLVCQLLSLDSAYKLVRYLPICV